MVNKKPSSKKEVSKKQTLLSLIKQDQNRLKEFCSDKYFKTHDGKFNTLEMALNNLCEEDTFKKVLNTMIVSELEFSKSNLTGQGRLTIYFDNDETASKKVNKEVMEFGDFLQGFVDYLKKKNK